MFHGTRLLRFASPMRCFFACRLFSRAACRSLPAHMPMFHISWSGSMSPVDVEAFDTPMIRARDTPHIYYYVRGSHPRLRYFGPRSLSSGRFATPELFMLPPIHAIRIVVLPARFDDILSYCRGLRRRRDEKELLSGAPIAQSA